MSTKAAEEPKAHGESEAAPAAPAGTGGGRGKMLKIGGIVALIIGAEIGITWFMLQPASSHHGAAKAEAGHHSEPEPEEDSESPAHAKEVQIGNGFSCTNSKATDSTIHIDFKLVALVSAGQSETFRHKLLEHEHRIRQAVDKVARSTRLEDLNDPSLSTMKRLIREEVNKILHKSYVMEIVISDFTTVEQ